MNYLFFDIECAACKKGHGTICEFGYVITDAKFNVKEKQIYLINPQCEFDWYVLKKMVAYKKAAYLSSPTYQTVFPKIKELFDRKDLYYFGHTVNADAGYLNDESRRFDLPFLAFDFYDVKDIYKSYTQTAEDVSVSRIATQLSTPLPVHEHRSVDDAEATMEIVKKFCEQLRISPEELIQRYPNCAGSTKDGHYHTKAMEIRRIIREQRTDDLISENLIKKDTFKLFSSYCSTLEINESASSVLAGKKVCISRIYETGHLKEMVFLANVLAEHGARCTSKASECNLYVEYPALDADGNEIQCPRKTAALLAIQDGDDVRICSFDELLDMIGVSEEELENAPPVDKTTLRQMIVNKDHQSKPKNSTIGDVLLAKGIDLKKICCTDES